MCLFHLLSSRLGVFLSDYFHKRTAAKLGKPVETCSAVLNVTPRYSFPSEHGPSKRTGEVLLLNKHFKTDPLFCVKQAIPTSGETCSFVVLHDSNYLNVFVSPPTPRDFSRGGVFTICSKSSSWKIGVLVLWSFLFRKMTLLSNLASI